MRRLFAYLCLPVVIASVAACSKEQATSTGPTVSNAPTTIGTSAPPEKVPKLTKVGAVDLPYSKLHAITPLAIAVTDGGDKLAAVALKYGAVPIKAPDFFGESRAVDVCGALLLGALKGDGAALAAVDLTTGKKAWEVPKTDCEPDARWQPFCGGNGDVPLAFETGRRTTGLHAYDLASGDHLWVVDLGGRDDTRTSPDSVMVDGAGRGDSLVSVNVADGSERWDNTDDLLVRLGGSAGVVVEARTDGKTTRHVVDSISGELVLDIPDGFDPFEERDVLAGTHQDPAVVMEKGTIITAKGQRDLAALTGLTEGKGTLRNGDVRPVGNGPDGFVWVTSSRLLALVDVVNETVIVKVAEAAQNLGFLGHFASVSDVE